MVVILPDPEKSYDMIMLERISALSQQVAALESRLMASMAEIPSHVYVPEPDLTPVVRELSDRLAAVEVNILQALQSEAFLDIILHTISTTITSLALTMATDVASAAAGQAVSLASEALQGVAGAAASAIWSFFFPDDTEGNILEIVTRTESRVKDLSITMGDQAVLLNALQPLMQDIRTKLVEDSNQSPVLFGLQSSVDSIADQLGNILNK